MNNIRILYAMKTNTTSSSKALFLDLDGTLLNDQKEVTPGNREAIEKALAAGNKVIISTGRPLVSAIDQAEKLGLTTPGCYLIAFNGCILYDTANKEIIYSISIPLDLVQKVFAEARRRDVHIQTYSNTRVLVEPCFDDPKVERYCHLTNMKYEVLPDISDLTVPPAKMLLVDYHNKTPLDDFSKWLDSWASDCLDNFFSCNEYLEIVPKGLSKGKALLQMADLLHIPVENTIAAGDAANDYTMLEAAHLGICMQNGSDELKAIADYVTSADNNHDGVAEIIEKFIL